MRDSDARRVSITRLYQFIADVLQKEAIIVAKRRNLTGYLPRAAKVLTFLCVGIAAPLLLFAPGCGQKEIVGSNADHASDTVFRVLEIDVGDESWGQNLLRVKVKNVTDAEQPFWLHIGGRYQHSGRPRGFGMGMGEPIVFKAGEERIVEHAYWIPPQVGELSYAVKFVLPAGNRPPQEQEAFAKRTYTVTYETPNHRCNELTPLPQFMEYDWAEKYRNGARIPPFEVVSTEHFVFYVLPDSPAERDIETIKSRRAQSMKEICAFLGVSFDKPVNFFLFGDAPSKRWCMSHQGDGLAFGTTIAEIYNKDVHVDPAHELTHIVASQTGNPPALLSEGLAVYMQAGHKWNDEDVDVTAGELLRDGKLAPLTELIKRSEIGSRPDDGKVAYPQSGSFVKFLIDRYGRGQFLKLYGNLNTSAEDNVWHFRNVLGVELESAEQEWREALSAKY